MNTESSNPYEPTAEELAQMQSATAAESQEVDALILAQCRSQWKKVAMLMGRLLDDFDTRYEHLPYCFAQARIEALEGKGAIDVRGDPWAMRYSEVRLRVAPSEA
jgi:hypothetical protein